MKQVSLVRWPALVVGCLALSLGARGEDLPDSLSKTGLVCEFTEESANAKHTHPLEKWKLKAHKSKIAIHERWFSDTRHYFDVLWSWPNELQDPDIYAVNVGSRPIFSFEIPFKNCPPPARALPFVDPTTVNDFVFAFGIHMIRNHSEADEPKSPHMLVYLPIDTSKDDGVAEATEFQLLLFHMDKDASSCNQDDPHQKARCQRLAELRKFWEAGNFSESELQRKVAASIRQILMVNRKQSDGDPQFRYRPFTTYWLTYLFGHNGVIHGTLPRDPGD